MPSDETKRPKRRRIITLSPDDLDRRPHPDLTPEEQAIVAEEARMAEAKVREERRRDPDGFMRRRREEIQNVKARQELEAGAYPAVLNRLKAGPADDRNCVVAYMTDVLRLNDQKIAEIFGLSEVWVRVARRRARLMFPCGNIKRLCGGRPGCSHKRARVILARLKDEVVRDMAEVGYE